VPYFSAAGNNARRSYESVFRPGEVVIGDTTYVAHDFDPGPGVDVYQQITVAPNSQAFFGLQWDSPFASTAPGAAGSPNDIDVYFFSDPPGQVVASSLDLNIGGDAVELLRSPPNTGDTPVTYNLVISVFQGAAPVYLKYIDFGVGTVTWEYPTNSSTSFGHPNGVFTVGVGAASFADTPAFGQSPPLLEDFSSAGSTPIFFDVQGNRLPSPQLRNQPRVVGPDATNNTFFGSDSPRDADDFPNFSGTSAAAPHVAAVAALMLQANPSLTPAQITDALQTSAIDMLTPGFDFDSGFGLVDAVGALQQVSTTPVAPTDTVTPGLSPTPTQPTATDTPGPSPTPRPRGDNIINLPLIIKNPVIIAPYPAPGDPTATATTAPVPPVQPTATPTIASAPPIPPVQPTATATTAPVPPVQPTATPTAAPVPPTGPLVVNGDFEAGSGVGWIEETQSGFPIIYSTDAPDLGVTPRSGNWLAWLGGLDDEVSTIVQDITLPVQVQQGQSLTLTFYYQIFSEDVCIPNADLFLVTFGPDVLNEVILCEGNETTGWTRASYDVSAYAGQTVRLGFGVGTDFSLLSSVYIDDVAIQAGGQTVQVIDVDGADTPGAEAARDAAFARLVELKLERQPTPPTDAAKPTSTTADPGPRKR
jgi:hypothetical protein